MRFACFSAGTMRAIDWTYKRGMSRIFFSLDWNDGLFPSLPAAFARRGARVSVFCPVLLVEAGQTTARHDEELRRDYQRLKFRRGTAVAKVAIATEVGGAAVLEAAQTAEQCCAAGSHADSADR